MVDFAMVPSKAASQQDSLLFVAYFSQSAFLCGLSMVKFCENWF